MTKLQVEDRYSMIIDILTSVRDRTDSIFEYMTEKGFEITDEENKDFINAIKYNIETLQRYL